MKSKNLLSRYSRRDAFSILKRDVQLLFLELKKKKEVHSFHFPNPEFSEKCLTVNVQATLATDERQVISYSIFFSPRESFHKISVFDRARDVHVLINKKLTTVTKLKETLRGSIQQKIKGYLLEEKVLNMVLAHTKKHPDTFIRDIKKTGHDKDRDGVDFDILVYHGGALFPIEVDITSRDNIEAKVKKNRDSYRLIFQVKYKELENPSKFLKDFKTKIKKQLKRFKKTKK